MFELSDAPPPSACSQTLCTVLLVDDEPKVLAGLALHLRQRYNVLTATSGGAALALLHNEKVSAAVVVSDMNMPGMDGATLLATVRKMHPESVRILLTDQGNLGSAIAAINDGQVFRFLTKPCGPAQLLAAIKAGIAQHDLLATERVLLHQTLHGSVAALVEVLSLTSPVTFGRAMLLKTLVGELAAAVNYQQVWQLEIAAMFSQLGNVALPAEVSEKMYHGAVMSDAETAMIARLPVVTDRLLAHIPRLQNVRDLLMRVARLAASENPIHDDAPEGLRDGAQLLDLARRYLQLEARGESAASAISLLRAGRCWCTPPLLDALQALRCGDQAVVALREVTARMLRVGMTLSEDLHLASGQLLAPRGYAVTNSFIERCSNARAGSIVEPVRIFAPG